MRLGFTAAAGLLACLISLGGCGGGAGTGSTATISSSPDLPSITAPASPTAPKRQMPDAETTTRASSDAAPATGARIRTVMAPFYSCLEQHGVRPAPLTGTGLRGNQIRNPQLVHQEIQARLACIQKLPPQFKAAGERFRQRFGR